MNELLDHLYSPKPFEKIGNNIWLDSLFSSFVFNSYFNSEIYGGSREPELINRTSLFFSEYFPSNKYKNLLDLGCGPGLYAEAFSEKGYNVTGVDYSSRAIEYATENSKTLKSNVEYYEDDILSFQSDNTFDICTIIYQMYSTFSYQERRKLLKNVYKLLNDDGLLIFDVPTVHYYEKLSPIKVWEHREQDNSISPNEHLVLYSLEKHDNNIILNKSIYIFENQLIKKFYDWIKCFDKNDIKTEINDLFKIESYFSEFDGTSFSNDSNNLTIVSRKI